MKKCLMILALVLMLPKASLAYSDVDDSHPYKTAIDSISEKGIVSGYADGTFKPSAKINRAEFTKIVVGAALDYNSAQDPSGYDIHSNQGLTFSDMEAKAWYIPYLRKAVENGIISGYPDGTFKPAQTINLAEAAKILTGSFTLATVQPTGSEWYSESIETLASKNTIPSTFKSVSQAVTRGEMAEMVWRILEDKTGQPSVPLAELLNPCNPLGDSAPANVDMARVREAWLTWYSDARAEQGLPPYSFNDQLARTANAWSETCKERGYMDHKRNSGDAYYAYGTIESWFKDLGLTFKNVSRVTFTENIGWGMVRCSKSDCTDDLIDAIRTTFDFFMAEKGTASHAHYDSVMNRYFKEIGLGIAVDETSGKYYLTVHYATEITSNPLPICSD